MASTEIQITVSNGRWTYSHETRTPLTIEEVASAAAYTLQSNKWGKFYNQIKNALHAAYLKYRHGGWVVQSIQWIGPNGGWTDRLASARKRLSSDLKALSGRIAELERTAGMSIQTLIAQWNEYAPKVVTHQRVAYKYMPRLTVRSGNYVLFRYWGKDKGEVGVPSIIQFTVSYDEGADLYDVQIEHFDNRMNVTRSRVVEGLGFEQFENLGYGDVLR